MQSEFITRQVLGEICLARRIYHDDDYVQDIPHGAFIWADNKLVWITQANSRVTQEEIFEILTLMEEFQEKEAQIV